MDLDKELQRYFGHTGFRPGQREVIEILLAGHSALAVFPTGAGKSLCYQLPAQLLDGLTLVVSPLIALMRDQVEALLARGVPAARLDSSFGAEEVRDLHAGMESGELKLLYVAPERLANAGFLDRLRRTRISLLAIDEAHCISSWGHNFRPDYLKLAALARDLQVPRILALTATATPQVSADIRAQFAIRPEHQVQTGFHRPNLAFRVTPSTAESRDAALLERLRSAPADPAIVYVTLQHTAESVATTLRKAGVNALAYHAGLPDDYRAEVQDRFMRGEAPVVVATIAFGMGIDKADLRAVYHYNLPKSLESYLQESGRAGRDGKDAICEIFVCPGDRIPLENFAYGDTPSPRAIRALVEHLLLQGEAFSVSRYDLSVTNDIRPLVIATALTELELDGVLIPEGPFYASYRIKPARPMERILAGFDPDRQDFLRRLFAAGKPGRSWITLDLAAAAASLGETQDRIRRALGYLEDLGDVVLEATGLRHAYRLNPDQSRNLGEISERLRARSEERERGEIARLDLVLAYCRTPGCKARHLVSHFGDTLDVDCGRCSSCEGPERAEVEQPEPEAPGFTDEDLALIRAVQAEKRPALRQPRQLARFLCGLSSPAATRDRLSRHDAFGALAHLPFPLVLAQVE